jgi:cytochrome c553
MTRLGLWGTIAVLVLAAVGGFVSYFWMPRAQLGAPESLFAAVCAALGVPQPRGAGLIIPVETRSDVVLTHETLQEPLPSDIGHGATLALRCTPCHGPTGISYANSPNLAGQYPIAVYKQLRDYKFGVRTNAVMTPMAQALSDADMRQIAAYYASLPKPRESRLTAEQPPIVRWGAPMRNVAPCGTCHGDIDHTLASPALGGEPRAYLSEQLQAFAAGTRLNDINGQMRSVAQGMTTPEIAAAADYYSGQSSSSGQSTSP